MSELSAEKRRRVAEACIPGHSIASIASWKPEESLYDKDKLTQTTARMIEEMPADYTEQMCRHLEISAVFIKALATGDVNAIEHLLSEMLEERE